MGISSPGQFPPALCIATVVQALVLAGFMVIILTRAGLRHILRERLFRWLAWVVVAYSGRGLCAKLAHSERWRTGDLGAGDAGAARLWCCRGNWETGATDG